MTSARTLCLALPAASALLAGCAGLAPGWDWPGERPPIQPAPMAAVVAAPAASLEDACHAEAWRHRLDVPGDQELGYGEAFRRCMQGQGASTRAGAVAPLDTPGPAQRPLPARAARS